VRIEVNFSALKRTKVHEHVVRFVLGGAVTVVTGLIAKRWGPVVGGLFLAFPAIFPAGATLIEEHEVEKKKEIGSDGRRRGREAAALDSLGAVSGSMGLAAFGLVLWMMLPEHGAGETLAVAVGAWGLVSVTLWVLRKRS
jgi:Protein of unknown function (DUF3147)